MRYVYFVIAFLFLFQNQTIMGQTDSLSHNQIVDEYNNYITAYSQLKKNQLEGYLHYINQHEPCKDAKEQENIDSAKKAYIREALKLFIGNGEHFVDEEGNYFPPPIVRLCVIDDEGLARETRIELKRFLTRLPYMRYSNLQIDTFTSFYAVEMKRLIDDEYLAQLECIQIPQRTDRALCCPSSKTITLKLNKKYIDGREMWPVFLGNITITATRK